MKTWMIILTAGDVLWSIAMLTVAKRMYATRVASAALIFGMIFIGLGAITFGAMTEAGNYLIGSLTTSVETRAEITRAIEELYRWRDFIWTTQVMIGAALVAHWVVE